MKKIALIINTGFEESEALTIVDIFRRANLHCDLVGFEKIVEGGQGIKVQSDFLWNEDIKNYDMIILPGGYEGVQNMMNHETLIHTLKEMNEHNKYICAMCAAPIVLEKAGLLDHKNFTAYLGYEKKIKQGYFKEDKVVMDGNIITGRGPATAYAFAYRLVDILGGDSLTVKKRMVYFNAFDVQEDE